MLRGRAPRHGVTRPVTRRSLSTAYTARNNTIVTRANGRPGSKEWQLYFYASKDAAKPISPWHDIPLLPEDMPAELQRKNIVNMVVEIPKGTNAKLEISKSVKNNPIVQDVKDGLLRVLRHGALPWNYGALPQTYEAPQMSLFGLKLKGDEDPLDVVEIGDAVHNVGDVVKVKVLGALCLIDQGEADWKLIGINTEDPLAASMHTARDIELQMQGKLNEIREWYRIYKVAEGKKENTYAFDGECLERDDAIDVLGYSHFSWMKYSQLHPDKIQRLPGFQ